MRAFFVGSLSATDLGEALLPVLITTPLGVEVRPECDLDEDFTVSPAHLVRACDAALAGLLPAERLCALGFFLIASDSFVWGTDTQAGSLVAETVHDWAAPEINFALTPENIGAFRARLLGQPFSFNVRHVPA